MIPVKIQCGCGQRYAFDIEPVNGRMPSAVACPVCGADGTTIANDIIVQSMPGTPTPVPARGVPLRISAPAPAHSADPAPSARPARTVARRPTLPGQIDPTQAEHEARAKVLWGDPPEEVLKYLMIQGFSHSEASSLVQGLFRERAATIRGNGITKIVVGIALIGVPIVAFFIFSSMGVIPLKLFAITIIVGLWGAWMIFNGIFMVVAPKSESGDVAEK